MVEAASPMPAVVPSAIGLALLGFQIGIMGRQTRIMERHTS
jgi:hypothetical protein